MLQDSATGQAVAARLLEFWGQSTPWQRRLWNVGTVSALKEVVEAATAAAESVLSEGSLKGLQSEVERSAGPDQGVGDSQTRRLIQKLLKEDLAAGRVEWHELQQVVPRIEEGYLLRWAEAVEELEQVGQERAVTSRKVV